jgi:hypothetical protein
MATAPSALAALQIAQASVSQPQTDLFLEARSSLATMQRFGQMTASSTLKTPNLQLKHGDIVQLGVDYQGGVEDIHKSVNIRIEVECASSNGELIGLPSTHHIATEVTRVEKSPNREPVGRDQTEETIKDDGEAQRQHCLTLSDAQVRSHP